MPKVLHLTENNFVWQQMRFQSLSGRNFTDSCSALKNLIKDQFPNADKLVKWEKDRSVNIRSSDLNAAQKKVRKLGIRELQAYNDSVRTLTNIKDMVHGALLPNREDGGEFAQQEIMKRMINLQFQQAVAMRNSKYDLQTSEGVDSVSTANELRKILENEEADTNLQKRMFLLYALMVQGDFDSKIREVMSSEPCGVNYKALWSEFMMLHAADWDPNLPCNMNPKARTMEDHGRLHNPIFREVRSMCCLSS